MTLRLHLLLPLLMLLLLVTRINAEPHGAKIHYSDVNAADVERLWKFFFEQTFANADTRKHSADLIDDARGDVNYDGGKKEVTTVRSRAANKTDTSPGLKTVYQEETGSVGRQNSSQAKEEKLDTNEVPQNEKGSNVDVNNLEDTAKAGTIRNEKLKSDSRQHKDFFVNIPGLERVYQAKDVKQSAATGIRKKLKIKQQKQKPGIKQKQESDIYFIRLPPAPYSYVPGLGYISRPPTFSSPGKRPQANPFIKLPIDFVSNGKPTGVYQWPSKGQQHHHNNHHHNHHQSKHKPDSTIIKLNRGPYVFDGRPMSVYLMKKNSRPAKNSSLR